MNLDLPLRPRLSVRRAWRGSRPALCALALSATCLAPVAAQTPPAAPAFMRTTEPAKSDVPAWFNLRLPGPETDLTKGAFDTAGTDFAARPATFARGPMNKLLAGRALHKDVATIVGFSHGSRAAGEFLWGRVTGRPAYDKTIDWTLAELKAAGLKDAHLETFKAVDVNLPVAGEVRLIGDEGFGAGSRDIVLASVMVGGTGPVNGEVTAPLIYVGQGLDADLAGRDLKGKIAVLYATPDPSLYASVPSGRIAVAMAAGAEGVVEIVAQPGNLKSYDGDRHGCGRGLCFTIGGEDGHFLVNALGAAAKAGRTINAHLSARSEALNRDIANVVATIPGKTDRTILINAHADGWFGAADDNATGLATMIALARYFATQPTPERTLVFIASAGHHTRGANGLRAFRARHDGDYVAKADLVINLEHAAQSGTMRSYVERQNTNFGLRMIATTGDLPKQIAVSNRAPYLIDLWRQGVECFGLDAQRVVDRLNPGELGAFANAPFPQTQMIASGQVYHTSGDDLYSITPEALERAARFHAYFIGEVTKAPAALLQGGPWKDAVRCPATP